MIGDVPGPAPTGGSAGTEESADQQSQPPPTGDVDLDAAMAELALAQSRSFAERIESGERVHRLLQGRLGDLGRA